MDNRNRIFALAVVATMLLGASVSASTFVNWENPHVHPLDMTPDGSRLLAVNTADNRLEVFEFSGGMPELTQSIPVGLDPVSVRARDDTYAWVVNHISDSISIVNLNTLNVVHTITTADEPTDVVFAAGKAFVSCSQVNLVQVFDDTVGPFPTTAIAEIPLTMEEPRAMEVSGNQVFVASFESGNKTTVLAGGSTMVGATPPNVVTESTPYLDTQGNPVNPPPNVYTPGQPADPFAFEPALATPTNPETVCAAPDEAYPDFTNGILDVGLIVRQDAAGDWLDDNDVAWTDVVSGPDAADSGRFPGWDLLDHDIAIIDANTFSVQYTTGVMNMLMALAIRPDGQVTAVGTDAINELRFEPLLNGRFLRVNLGVVNPATASTSAVHDLNSHLTYASGPDFVPVAPAIREQSIGDPRGIAWKGDGSGGFVSGMGSNNVVLLNADGTRAGTTTIEVGEGPTGLVLDETRAQLYVLNKFSASLSVVSTTAQAEIGEIAFYDPSPAAIKTGRKHLYDTHLTSGLGHVACASCHVDARTDRLSWDLGNPAGCMKVFNNYATDGTCPTGNCQNCVDGNCDDWHPMKGPMTTQTLQDIIGHEPLHWRGDRDDLGEFAGAFDGLLGDDENRQPGDASMAEFSDFLATIHFPPNPFRKPDSSVVPDNSLPSGIELEGHFATDKFANLLNPIPGGTELISANLGYVPDPNAGLADYIGVPLDGPFFCASCHTLPTGTGTNFALGGVPIPLGPRGEIHHLLVSVDGSTNVTMKVPQLRNMHEKVGFNVVPGRPDVLLAGAGFLHDGSVPTLADFFMEPAFNFTDSRQVIDMIAFMLAFSGSDLPAAPNPLDPALPPGTASKDTHAAVGVQRTSTDPLGDPFVDDMITLAETGAVGLTAKSFQGGRQRGYSYVPGTPPALGYFQSDRSSEQLSAADLQMKAGGGREVTYTIVPAGSETRIGVDRDEDGAFDRDELDGCSDPADPSSTPPQCGGGGPSCPPTLETQRTGCGLDPQCNQASTLNHAVCGNAFNIATLHAGMVYLGPPAQGFPLGYAHVINHTGPQPTTAYLQILNGAGGQYRVNAAAVRVNGVEVLGQNDITSGDGWVEIPVTLQPGVNQLFIDNQSDVIGAMSVFVLDAPMIP